MTQQGDTIFFAKIILSVNPTIDIEKDTIINVTLDSETNDVVVTENSHFLKDKDISSASFLASDLEIAFRFEGACFISSSSESDIKALAKAYRRIVISQIQSAIEQCTRNLIKIEKVILGGLQLKDIDSSVFKSIVPGIFINRNMDEVVSLMLEADKYSIALPENMERIKEMLKDEINCYELTIENFENLAI